MIQMPFSTEIKKVALLITKKNYFFYFVMFGVLVLCIGVVFLITMILKSKNEKLIEEVNREQLE